MHNNTGRACVCACARRRGITSARRWSYLPVFHCEQQSNGGENLPMITIHSTDNVTRGKIGSFVLDMTTATDAKSALTSGGRYVNFKVSGTAIAGVDYVLLVSPARIGQSGYGVIQVKTLRDPRGSYLRQALERYSNSGSWRRI